MPRPQDFPYDVFLSHNHADKPRVRRLGERLKAAGVQMEAGLRLWWDEWVIQAGDIIALKVDEGLEQSRVLLLLPVSQLSTLNQPAPPSTATRPMRAGALFRTARTLSSVAA